MYKSELARLAGVSANTFRRYLNSRRDVLASMGVTPRAQTLPPRAVKYVVEDYCIDLPENCKNFSEVLPMSTKDHQRPPPMLYLCNVLRTQALALVFAESKRLRLHTPGNSTCRLRRQQNETKKGLKP